VASNERRRSLTSEESAHIQQQQQRRSSLGVPDASLAARRRSFAGPDNVPMRRSSLAAVESIPNRKAYLPPSTPFDEEEPEFPVPAAEVKISSANSNLPAPESIRNRKAYVPAAAPAVQAKAPANSQAKVEVKVSPIDVPNRKAYIFPEAAPSGAAKPDTRIKLAHPSTIPNRKAYVFPEVVVSATVESSEHEQEEGAFVNALDEPEIKLAHPSTLMNRKAFVFPEASFPENGPPPRRSAISVGAGAPPARGQVTANAFQAKLANPWSIPNRKAFIAPEDQVSAYHQSADDVAPEDVGPQVLVEEPEQIQESTSDEPAQGGATAIPLFKRSANPLAKEGVVDWDAAHVGYSPRCPEMHRT
jgi:hypothetical protein